MLLMFATSLLWPRSHLHGGGARIGHGDACRARNGRLGCRGHHHVRRCVRPIAAARDHRGASKEGVDKQRGSIVIELGRHRPAAFLQRGRRNRRAGAAGKVRQVRRRLRRGGLSSRRRPLRQKPGRRGRSRSDGVRRVHKRQRGVEAARPHAPRVRRSGRRRGEEIPPAASAADRVVVVREDIVAGQPRVERRRQRPRRRRRGRVVSTGPCRSRRRRSHATSTAVATSSSFPTIGR